MLFWARHRKTQKPINAQRVNRVCVGRRGEGERGRGKTIAREIFQCQQRLDFDLVACVRV